MDNFKCPKCGEGIDPKVIVQQAMNVLIDQAFATMMGMGHAAADTPPGTQQHSAPAEGARVPINPPEKMRD